MPLYDYKCDDCQEIFEIKKSFEDKSEERCKSCSTIMTRQLTVPAVQFKGKGFYSTDNRK